MLAFIILVPDLTMSTAPDLSTPATTRPATDDDTPAIAEIHRRAFERDDESTLVERLHASGETAHSLVAVCEDRVVGHVLFCPIHVRTTAGDVPGLALAPIAVLPEFQKRGVGAQLVRDGLRNVTELGHRFVTVLGEPDFYRRFGFSHQAARSLEVPFPQEYWMAMELMPGGLNGLEGPVIYPAAFGIA